MSLVSVEGLHSIHYYPSPPPPLERVVGAFSGFRGGQGRVILKGDKGLERVRGPPSKPNATLAVIPNALMCW